MSLVIVLNGTSSAGKTSIAKALQARYDGVLLHLSVDAWFEQLPARFASGAAPLDAVQSRAMFLGFHGAIAAAANAGNDVVLDALLLEPEWLADLRDGLAGHRVRFVGVRCPLAELERREAARGDRRPGLAASQLDVVHAHGPYDLEVDTSALSADACAERILAHLADSATTVFWPQPATSPSR